MGETPSFAEEELRQAMELLFFAYRDFTGEADEILSQYGFGRAHHRVIYFVKRNPGLTVNRLLDILKITKQSLSRVLGQLVREGFIDQRTDIEDRRRRILSLTDNGEKLESKLTRAQGTRISKAYKEAGEQNISGFKKVLTRMINDADRQRFSGGGPHTHPLDSQIENSLAKNEPKID
ncbi:MAG: MarR family transcriptional regulator [Rhodospirillaceae bacterium]|nr:MarR family transcriptional regulator [Rhodospirillaceae bacterium]